MAERAPAVHYTPELGEHICKLIAEGYSVITITAADWAPSQKTIYEWLKDKPEFRDRYMLAKEMQADKLAEEIIAIADDSSGDIVIKVGRDGKEYETVDWENVQRSKLRIDARKWYAGKLRPKVYGERYIPEDPEDNVPPPTTITVRSVDSSVEGEEDDD